VLRRGDFGYLGLIGSATKRAKFLRRFEQRGIADEVVARLTCPIGVPGIAGKQPEVIALAVVAQLLQQASQTQ
jgi:xanthine dehydrogenase accessory factor